MGKTHRFGDIEPQSDLGKAIRDAIRARIAKKQEAERREREKPFDVRISSGGKSIFHANYHRREEADAAASALRGKGVNAYVRRNGYAK